MSVGWQRLISELSLSKSKTTDYVPLRTSKEGEGLALVFRPEKKYKWHSIYAVTLILISIIGSGAIGFALGSRNSGSPKGRMNGFGVHHYKETFKDTNRGRFFNSAGRHRIPNGV